MSYAEPEIVVDFAADEEVIPLTPQQGNHVDPLSSGFLWYTPPMAATPELHHDSGSTWSIGGHDFQVLAMTLPPGGQIITEVGTFMFGSPDIQTNVELTLCRQSGIMEGCRRILGGESCVKVVLVNPTSDGYVGITPNFPAKIMPIQFGKHLSQDKYLIGQRGAYLSHIGDVDVGCDVDLSPLTCCCGGLGCLRQKITGSEPSIAFLNAGGTIVYRLLQENETITIDTNSLLAMESTVQLGITPNGRCTTMLCGGECCCSTTVTGPGKVFMQSMSFYKFQQAVQQTIVAESDRGDPNQNITNFSN